MVVISIPSGVDISGSVDWSSEITKDHVVGMKRRILPVSALIHRRGLSSGCEDGRKR